MQEYTLLALVAFLGGVFTIVSPCVLPVIPFVLGRQGRSFTRSTLPLLAGMVLTFAVIATLAAVGGAWAVHLNVWGRVVALVMLAVFGVALLSRRVGDAIAKPFVALGNRLTGTDGKPQEESVAASLTIGIATGFLWAPCAGPILGLILTGAAISGPGARTTLLLFAFALGAATSMGVVAFAGARLLRGLKRSLGVTEWLRRGLGIAVLAGVVAIAAGWDTGLLARLSFASTNRIEQSILGTLHPPGGADGAMTGTMSGAMTGARGARGAARDEGELPSLDGAALWLNSPPLTSAGLRGKVVMIDFWTYSCINCLRTLPYLRAWYERYKDLGLVIIGVHSPEFAFEKVESNVRRAVKDLDVRYPVALDNDYTIWRAFSNEYWPAHYFVDAQGRVRGHHFGEGNYEESEELIRTLLTESGQKTLPQKGGPSNAGAIEVPAAETRADSPETYVGYDRAENMAGTTAVAHDKPATYQAPATLQLNQWGLGGTWSVHADYAESQPRGRIVFRFRARDLHLVLSPAPDGRPIRFRVTLDGQSPGQDHGADIDASGAGTVREERLYQLIRQSEGAKERTFSMEFEDSGARAYAFTFG